MESKPVKKDKHALSRQEWIALSVFFILAIAYGGWRIYNRNSDALALGEDINIAPPGIVVQVEGAVVSPGMVRVREGARVSEAIEAAGGFLENADRDALSLMDTLEDGERIVVPFLEQTGQHTPASDENESYIRRTPLPDDGNPPPDAEEPAIVNINTAGISELMTLPGIGEEIATRIIDYRDIHGPFLRIEDILMVEGIGEARYNEIKDLITVED